MVEPHPSKSDQKRKRRDILDPTLEYYKSLLQDAVSSARLSTPRPSNQIVIIQNSPKAGPSGIMSNDSPTITSGRFSSLISELSTPESNHQHMEDTSDPPSLEVYSNKNQHEAKKPWDVALEEDDQPIEDTLKFLLDQAFDTPTEKLTENSPSSESPPIIVPQTARNASENLLAGASIASPGQSSTSNGEVEGSGIFRTAAAAFRKLGNLTLMLERPDELKVGDGAGSAQDEATTTKSDFKRFLRPRRTPNILKTGMKRKACLNEGTNNSTPELYPPSLPRLRNITKPSESNVTLLPTTNKTIASTIFRECLINGQRVLLRIETEVAASNKSNAQRKEMNNMDWLSLANTVIGEMSNKMELPRSIQDLASQTFKDMFDKKIFRRSSGADQAAACLYFACRKEGVPRSFKEICAGAISKVSRKEIGRCFQLIVKTLDTSLDHFTSADFMSRFCNNLGLPFHIQAAATRIAKKAVELDLVGGRSPVTLTAAAIYMASQASAPAYKKTSKEISEITGVAEMTILQAYRLLLPEAVELFPANANFYIDELPRVNQRAKKSK